MPDSITLEVNGKPVNVPRDAMVSTAIALAGHSGYRISVTGESRGPLCGMGICFECRVTIDGRGHQRACQTLCRAGMQVWTDVAERR